MPFRPRHNATSISTSAMARAMKVAQALPTAPIAGKPRWPKINAQASGMLIRFAISVTINGVRVSPAPRSTPLPMYSMISTTTVPMVTCR